MSSPKLTPEQAAIVDAALARQEQYLHPLAKRLKKMGINHPHPLMQWAEKAEWTVGGLRVHFAEWAKGQDSSALAQHVAEWKHLLGFQITPVLEDADAAKALASVYGK
ncbi:MAG: DUF3303 family protein [Tepidisphaeraceae bacterium]|jgi:hypothetical protein